MRGDGLTREVCCDQLTSECCDQSVHTSCTHTCHQPVTSPGATAAEPILLQYRSTGATWEGGTSAVVNPITAHCNNALISVLYTLLLAYLFTVKLHHRPSPRAGQLLVNLPRWKTCQQQHLIVIKFVVFYRSTDLLEMPGGEKPKNLPAAVRPDHLFLTPDGVMSITVQQNKAKVTCQPAGQEEVQLELVDVMEVDTAGDGLTDAQRLQKETTPKGFCSGATKNPFAMPAVPPPPAVSVKATARPQSVIASTQSATAVTSQPTGSQGTPSRQPQTHLEKLLQTPVVPPLAAANRAPVPITIINDDGRSRNKAANTRMISPHIEEVQQALGQYRGTWNPQEICSTGPADPGMPTVVWYGSAPDPAASAGGSAAVGASAQAPAQHEASAGSVPAARATVPPAATVMPRTAASAAPPPGLQAPPGLGLQIPPPQAPPPPYHTPVRPQPTAFNGARRCAITGRPETPQDLLTADDNRRDLQYNMPDYGPSAGPQENVYWMGGSVHRIIVGPPHSLMEQAEGLCRLYLSMPGPDLQEEFMRTPPPSGQVSLYPDGGHPRDRNTTEAGYRRSRVRNTYSDFSLVMSDFESNKYRLWEIIPSEGKWLLWLGQVAFESRTTFLIKTSMLNFTQEWRFYTAVLKQLIYQRFTQSRQIGPVRLQFRNLAPAIKHVISTIKVLATTHRSPASEVIKDVWNVDPYRLIGAESCNYLQELCALGTSIDC